MSFYVRIDRMNGRSDHMRLGDWLNRSGVVETHYYKGGWDDNHVHSIAPHLKFEREDDAIAYVLAHGGSYTTTVPELVPGIDYLPGG